MIDSSQKECSGSQESFPDPPGGEGDERTFTVGMDIGGSHVASLVVDAASGRLEPQAESRLAVDANGSADSILDRWAEAARLALDHAGRNPAGIGIAMPGPFDYAKGIALLQGLNKYESLYGMNVGERLKERLSLPKDFHLLFRNDAVCFLLGEHWQGAARGHDTSIAITLGTGIGSAFLKEGRIVHAGKGVPEGGGWVYPLPFRGATAEDYFSTRGIVKRYRAAGGNAEEVKEIAENAPGEKKARDIFAEMGSALAEFLEPWIADFEPTCLVIGGNVGRAWWWFAPTLESRLTKEFPRLEVRSSLLFDRAGLLGAARLPLTAPGTVPAEYT